MDGPFVLAVLLTRDRPEMARRAVRCFDAQTYPAEDRHLIVYNTGGRYDCDGLDSDNVDAVYSFDSDGLTIGALRNRAISLAQSPFGSGCTPDIIITWDDDDISHPRRIEEQVALLQSSGADVVGYSDLLFRQGDETWLYRCNEPWCAPGTTLCFWRRVWERRQYPATSSGEDWQFTQGRKVVAESSLKGGEPRMIATIHGRNTGQATYEASLAKARLTPAEFRRAPEWDHYQIPMEEFAVCRE
jgi:glycosyltransferase involved in cell wall biosynthesis